MVNAGDRAGSQILELDDALDDLESNRFVLGEHHLSLAVFADTPQELADNLAKARSHLTNGGAVVAREDLGLAAAWWAQLPGNYAYRTRSGAITSRNYAALSPFHSFPVGKIDGNVWGPAVALMKTSAGSPFYFNFHFGDLGNTFVCGPSGSGKTVIVNFLLAQLQKHDPNMVFFDKDRGAELFVRAGGGTYMPLKNGKPTGIAPLKGLDYNNPADRVFLRQWITKLVSAEGQKISESERQDIAAAVDQLALLPKEQRTISALQMFFDTTHREGISGRLERWCKGNALGWVFDNPDDDIGIDAKFIGYDMTDFLDNEEIAHVAIGNSVAWEVAPAGNILFLKAREVQPITNLQVVTTRRDGSKRSYQFELTVKDGDISTGQDTYFLVKFRYPQDEAEQRRIEGLLSQARKQAQRIDGVFDTYEKYGPRNWAYTAQGSVTLEPSSVYDNGKTITFTFPDNQEIPAIYIISSDGTESLVPKTTNGNMVIVHAIGSRFTLRHGKNVLCIFNEAYQRQGINPKTGTTSPSVERKIASDLQ